MAKATKQTPGTREPDSVYFLKILIYFVMGLIWVKYNGYLVFPLGLVLGILIAQKDHFAIDRKVEYAVLLVASLLGFTGGGVFLSFWGS